MASLLKNKIDFTLLTGLTAILVGTVVLFGWYFDTTLLKSFLPGFPEMKANTALVCLGFSSIFLAYNKKIGTYLFLLPVFLITILTLGEFITNTNIGIDEILF